MRNGYDSRDYWEHLNEKNKTIRGHMFMEDIPRKDSIYIHTLSFVKKNGIQNVWAYFPNFNALLGYLQYSFLQENFFKWIYGKEKKVTKIPTISVEEVINKALKENKITKAESQSMKEDIVFLSKIWKMPQDKGLKELQKFCRNFNKKWYGDSAEFLYIKIFNRPEEMGQYIIDSCKLTGQYSDITKSSNLTEEDWIDLCKSADKDIDKGERFRNILLKKLTEIL